MQSAATVLGVLRNHRRAGYPETGPSGSEGGRAEKDQFTLAPRRPADPTRIDAEEFYRLLEGQVIDDTNLFSQKLQEWEDYYNYHRPHGALGGQTPYERLRQKTADPLS